MDGEYSSGHKTIPITVNRWSHASGDHHESPASLRKSAFRRHDTIAPWPVADRNLLTRYSNGNIRLWKGPLARTILIFRRIGNVQQIIFSRSSLLAYWHEPGVRIWSWPMNTFYDLTAKMPPRCRLLSDLLRLAAASAASIDVWD
jgi:hypothetical protein